MRQQTYPVGIIPANIATYNTVKETRQHVAMLNEFIVETPEGFAIIAPVVFDGVLHGYRWQINDNNLQTTI